MSVVYIFENQTQQPVHLDCVHYFKGEEIGKSQFELDPQNKFALHLPPQATREFFIRLTLQKDENVKFNQGTRTPDTVIMGLIRERDQAGPYAIVRSND